ncbi:MAG: hypothetical protein ACM3PE_09995 [Deltaproteobacteria bacterium]
MSEASYRYISRPGMTWAVEENGILLIDPASGRQSFLEYPEAALWDLLSRCHSVERAAPVMKAVIRSRGDCCQDWSLEQLQIWADEGWLLREDSNG